MRQPTCTWLPDVKLSLIAQDPGKLSVLKTRVLAYDCILSVGSERAGVNKLHIYGGSITMGMLKQLKHWGLIGVCVPVRVRHPRYAGRAAQLKAAINKALWDEKKGAYFDNPLVRPWPLTLVHCCG